eukprot:TRINITY_DN2335_c4_g1_i1.p1 TRINITY_DN2335_c4_g1~~TRINITY_DN2335_c4_g1_i1.p1  ORF type:complete len:1016 (+),score=201.25 TRINITY_DN2335_c4_g1_i1:41-3049(+)
MAKRRKYEDSDEEEDEEDERDTRRLRGIRKTYGFGDDDTTESGEEGNDSGSDEEREVDDFAKRGVNFSSNYLDTLGEAYGVRKDDSYDGPVPPGADDDDDEPSVGLDDLGAVDDEEDSFDDPNKAFSGYKPINVAAEGLYPTIADPKLFMCRVKSGFARTLCTQIMYKCMALSAQGKDLMIKSVFCRDHLSDYIYVEAYREAHVLNAISGLQGAWRKVKLIPVGEMPSTLAKIRTVGNVRPGSWGRFRYGVHKGDLCKIVGIDNSKEAFDILVIPRIDFDKLIKGEDSTNVAGFGVNKLKSRTRNLQRFFADDIFCQTNLCKMVNGRPTTMAEYCEGLKAAKEKYIKIWGKKFSFQGHEFKTVRQQAISTDSKLVNLTTDEHIRFSHGKMPKSRRELDILQSAREVDLQVGDIVRVTTGELQNTQGEVVEIYQDATGVKYKVMPIGNQYLTEVIPFTKESLEKIIRDGAHVMIVSGVHKGETGMVVSVNRNTGLVRVYSSASRTEYEVFSSDLVESQELSRGVPHLGQFDVFDLVNLRGAGSGMITKIQNEHFTILNQHGKEVIANHTEIEEVISGTELSRTRKGRRQTALDRFGNEISQGDAVQVISDKSLWEAKRGTIKHVYKDAVWIAAKDIRINMGFIVLTRHDVWLIGGMKSVQDTGIDSYIKPMKTVDTPDLNMADILDPKDPKNKKKIRQQQKNATTLIGQRVRVVKGYYKTLLGIVTGIHGATARVEMHTGEMNITFKLDEIKPIDASDTLATSDQQALKQIALERQRVEAAAKGQNAMMDIDVQSEGGHTAASDWMSSRAGSMISGMTGLGSILGADLESNPSTARSHQKRKRPGRRYDPSRLSSAASSNASLANSLVSKPEHTPVTTTAAPTQSATTPVSNGLWWMVPSAKALLTGTGPATGPVYIVSNGADNNVLVRNITKGVEREVPATSLTKPEAQISNKVAVIDRPGFKLGREPIASGFVSYVLGDNVIVRHGELTDSVPQENVVLLH